MCIYVYIIYILLTYTYTFIILVQLKDGYLKTQSKRNCIAKQGKKKIYLNIYFENRLIYFFNVALDYESQEIPSNSSESSAYNVPTTVPTIRINEKEISHSTLLNKSCGSSCMHRYHSMYKLSSISTSIFIALYYILFILYIYVLEKIFIEIKKLREQVKEIHGILKQFNIPIK